MSLLRKFLLKGAHFNLNCLCTTNMYTVLNYKFNDDSCICLKNRKKERYKEQFVFLHKFIQLSLKGMLKRKVQIKTGTLRLSFKTHSFQDHKSDQSPLRVLIQKPSLQ